MVQILLADDHEVMRRGIRALLESHPDFVVCAEAADGREAVALATRTRPEVGILDLTMPGLNGLEATRLIRSASPETEVLLYTMHASEQIQQEALRAGAQGYVLKSDGANQLLSAVRSLAEHRRFLSSGASSLRQRTPARTQPRRPSERLTPREREIAQLLAEGKTNWCIANILGIGTKTVETHRGNIMLKLGLESIVELVHYAVRNQMVAP